MVLESTISSVLQSQLKQWVKIRGSDVGVGIRGGHLVLENAELNTESLNNLSLPFKILSGQASRLRVDVPWISLRSKPVEVYVEDVHLTAGKKPMTDEGPPCSEEKPVPDTTRSGSEVTPTSNESAVDGDRWHESFVFRLAANIRVEINGLRLEYTDESCSTSLSFTSLKSTACDASWEPAFIAADDSSGIPITIRRKLELECLQCQMIRTLADSRREFEGVFPVLAGLNLEFRVFLCTGGDGAFSSAQFVEVEVDVEEPNISLSARQVNWLTEIFGLETSTKQSELGKDRLPVEPQLGNDGKSLTKEGEESQGPMSLFWSYIVGENGYVVEDDAAGVLDLREDNAKDEPGVDDPADLDHKLELAGNAGGFTIRLNLTTPDGKSRSEVAKLKKQLQEGQLIREDLQRAREDALEAESKARAAAEQASILMAKNRALQKEVAELEHLAGEQSRNKDAIIRQLQAAVTTAERKLLDAGRLEPEIPSSGTSTSPLALPLGDAPKGPSTWTSGLLEAGTLESRSNVQPKESRFPSVPRPQPVVQASLGDGVELI
uniref:Chorein N-terminal domain-containing protein n=1 Tax=Rhodosorus marinus TaxID=101924 RepID=A0A7S0BFY4_9RHOD|mmetsp:Transcript_14973/g.22036  ORF Transcript_14973/g.22036 Transcript_14973/m.22036 type:complete len:550 (+) Transcript_14973:220-1869(+)